MKKNLSAWCAVAVLLASSASWASSVAIEGEYVCTGKDVASGQPYTEKMAVEKKGDVYEVKWTPQDESPYIGMGVLSDDGKKWYASYVKANSAKSNGILVMTPTANGAGVKLEGKSADFGDSSMSGVYSCQR